MPNFVSVKVTGLAELENALLEQTPKKARAAVREALEFVGEFLRLQMVLRAPSRSGFLASHIVKAIKLSAKNDEGTVQIGPSKEAYYAQFDEFGSIHNEPPHPFIRPAFEQNKDKAVDLIRQKIAEALGL